MSLRISIHTSNELQVLRARYKQLPTELRSQLNKATRADALPIWRRSLEAQPATVADRKVLIDTAKVGVSARNIELRSATVGKPLTGGLNPKTDARALEFGAIDPDQRSRYSTRRGGHRYVIERRARRQLPHRKRTGRVVYPAAAEAIPALASLWVQTAVRTTYEAHEGV